MAYVAQKLHTVCSVSWMVFVVENRNGIAPLFNKELQKWEDCQWNKVMVPPLSLNKSVQGMVGALVT